MPVNSEIHDDGRQMLAGHLSTVHAVVSKLATLDLAAVVDGVALIRTTGRYAVVSSLILVISCLELRYSWRPRSALSAIISAIVFSVGSCPIVVTTDTRHLLFVVRSRERAR